MSSALLIFSPFLFVFLLKAGFPEQIYLTLFCGFAFGHYLLAITSLKMKSFQKGRFFLILVPLVAAISLLLHAGNFSLSLYFGIHWLMAEIYLNKTDNEFFRVRLIYLTVFYALNYIVVPNAQIISSGLAMFISISLFAVLIGKHLLSEREKNLHVVLSDFAYFVYGGVSVCFYDNHFREMVFIHLVQFIFLFLPKQGAGKIIQYVGFNSGIIAAFIVLFHPQSAWYIGGLNIQTQLQLFGVVHITHSFFVSRLNPAWIRTYLAGPFLAK